MLVSEGNMIEYLNTLGIFVGKSTHRKHICTFVNNILPLRVESN